MENIKLGKVITKKDISLSRDKIMQALVGRDYAETLSLHELAQQLEVDNKKVIEEKILNLEQEYEAKQQAIIEANNKVHDSVLHFIETFKHEYFMQLQNISQKVAAILLGSGNEIDLFIHKLKNTFDEHSINVTTALNQNLKIEVTEAGYNQIILWLETRENVENIKWIKPHLEINSNLKNGTARVCDDYLDIAVSTQQVIKHLANMLELDYKPIVNELTELVPDFPEVDEV